jgi:hypothetical protein
MYIPKEKFVRNISVPESLGHILKNVDAVVSLKDMNGLLQTREKHGDVHISLLKETDLIHLLRQVKDHRGTEVYKRAEINSGEISHTLVRNYQTFADLQKIGGIMELNSFFTTWGFPGAVAASNALVVKCEIGDTKLASIYVPPLIEHQQTERVVAPLKRLKERASKEPVIKLPGFTKKGNSHFPQEVELELKPIIEDWERMLSGPTSYFLVLKDGTHRCTIATMANAPVHAIMINPTDSLMQSVPVMTGGLTLTWGKPESREDRMLGMDWIDTVRWEGWVDLASIGIDG